MAVEWTKKGREYIANKEYRYLSPVVLVKKADQHAAVFHSAALTNIPAITGMFAIINSDVLSIEEEEEEPKMEKAKVYFTDFRCKNGVTLPQKLRKLVKARGSIHWSIKTGIQPSRSILVSRET